MSNQYHLTKRELEVAEQLVEGKSNSQIALELQITERTVEYHLTNIYKKLGVSSAKEAFPILWKSADLSKPGESTVDPASENGNNGSVQTQNIGTNKIWLFVAIGFLIVLGYFF